MQVLGGERDVFIRLNDWLITHMAQNPDLLLLIEFCNVDSTIRHRCLPREVLRFRSFLQSESTIISAPYMKLVVSSVPQGPRDVGVRV